jgi:hypothetical protein
MKKFVIKYLQTKFNNTSKRSYNMSLAPFQESMDDSTYINQYVKHINRIKRKIT